MSISTTPQTVSGILGDINNDVIVTTASQFWNTNVGQTVEFPYLAHTALPAKSVALPLGSGSNDSVNKSSEVADCVAQILLTASTSGAVCQTTVPTAPAKMSAEIVGSLGEFDSVQQRELESSYPGEDLEDTEERNRHPLTFAPQRMSVNMPNGNISLGNPIDLTLSLAPGKLIGTLTVMQSGLSGELDEGSGPAKTVKEDDPTKTIEVVPVQLGPLSVMIQAVYSDNTVVRQTVHLNVEPSAKGLKKFSLDQGSHVMALVLEDEEKDSQQLLKPMVWYKDVDFPIFLDDSSQINLSVEQDDGDPAIRVDKNGMVHALREGKAVLVGNFDGVQDRIQVTVFNKEDAPVGYRTVIR